MENALPNGIFFNPPNDNAPEFVKGRLSIKIKDAVEWLNEQEGDNVNLDLLVSKAGKGYVKLNEWKPDGKKSNRQTPDDPF